MLNQFMFLSLVVYELCNLQQRRRTLTRPSRPTYNCVCVDCNHLVPSKENGGESIRVRRGHEGQRYREWVEGEQITGNDAGWRMTVEGRTLMRPRGRSMVNHGIERKRENPAKKFPLLEIKSFNSQKTSTNNHSAR
jgi:hypothetical protein